MSAYPGSTSRDYTFVTGSGASAKGSLVEIAAVSGQHHCIQRCDFSYSGDGAGELTIGLATTVSAVPTTTTATVDDATGFSVSDVPVRVDNTSSVYTQLTPARALTAVNETTNLLTFDGTHGLAIGDVIIKVEYMLYVTGGGAGPLVGNDTPLFIGDKGVRLGIWLKDVSGNASRLNVLYY
jgi:hypothetical protein